MTVAEPPWKPEPEDCQRCKGSGKAYPRSIWLEQGELCQHCEGPVRVR